MRVDASVDGGVLNWRYKAGGNEWRQSLPLNKLVPCPMISIDRNTRWRYIALTCLSPPAICGLLLWLGRDTTFAIGAAVVALLVLGYHSSPWFQGPIEWAVFDTTLKDKTVYVFRGQNDSDFDAFVDSLDKAIDAAWCHQNEGD